MRSRDYAMDAKSEAFRLETPAMSGFRAGMSSSSMIGRKLGRLYNPPADMPSDIGQLIQVIDRKFDRAG